MILLSAILHFIFKIKSFMPKSLNLSYEELEKLASIYGTPFQLYDGDGITRHVQTFLKTFKESFPSFKQFFAVKALPNPSILKLLLDNGLGFDCSSTAEVKLVLEIGALPKDIIYSSNYTSVEDLSYAVMQNVIINLDDYDGLMNLCETGLELPELLSFRLNPNMGTTDSETKSNVLGGIDSKFGMDPETCIEAFVEAKKRGVKKFGIHMMTGSCVMDITYWSELIDALYVTIKQLHDLNIKLEFIDIGGGIGIPYQPNIPDIDIKIISKNIRKAITSNISKYGLDYEPQLFMENGRYITGQFGWLVSRCQSVKKTKSDNIFYGLDACMANLMRPGMYGAYHHITIPRIQKTYQRNDVMITTDTDLMKSHVVGTLCENNDWFASNRMLPKETKKGDLFIIYDTGAHSHSMGFQYNSKLRAPEILIIKSKISLIRKRETYDSLFGNCIKIDL